MYSFRTLDDSHLKLKRIITKMYEFLFKQSFSCKFKKGIQTPAHAGN